VEKNEIEHALKMLALMKVEENKCEIGIVIERLGMPELVLTWDLKLYKERGEIYNFYEYFEELEAKKDFYFHDTTIYIYGINTHIFILLNALISKNPKKIIYKRTVATQNSKETAEWYYARRRAKLRNLEIIEM
jgi:hypothetical protein